MKLYGSLENASLEALSADPTAVTQGRVYLNTATLKVMLDNGTNKRAFILNDGKAVFGTSATASNNIRFHRSGNTVFQLVAGDDVTTEGTSSASLAQLSARAENYTFSALPTVGQVGRTAYVSDRKSLYVDTGSNWAPVGSGSGSGGKNYLGTVNGVNGNGDFELGALSGWGVGTVGTLSATKLPGAGFLSTTGANANFVPSVVSTGQLAGTYSARVASTVATTAGDCFYSPLVTIEAEEKAKVLAFKFAYQLTSGTASFAADSTNSFGIAIWDADNGAWIIPAGVFSMNQSSGVGIASGTFQTPANVGQLRLVVYNANATAGAVTMLFDDFYLGPQSIATDGRVIAFRAGGNPTGTLSGAANAVTYPTVNSDTVGGYSSPGYVIKISGYYDISACLGISGTYTVGQLADLLLQVDGTTIAEGPIPAQASVATTLYPAVNIKAVYLNAGQVVRVASYFTGSIGTFGGGPTVNYFTISRVSGPTSGDEGRVISAKAGPATNTAAIASGTLTKVPLTAAIADRGGMVDTTNQRFNIGTAGDYMLSVTLSWGGSINGLKLLGYRVNGGSDVYISTIGTGDRPLGVALIPTLKAGDYVEVYARQDSGTSVILNSIPDSAVSLFRLSGPNAASAAESYGARYVNNAGTALPNGSNFLVPFTQKDYDSHSWWTGTQYNIGVSGKYCVTALIQTAVTAFTTGLPLNVYVFKNGAYVTTLGASVAPAFTGNFSAGGSDEVSCVAGDYLQIYVYISPATTLNTTFGTNHVSFKRVGN